MATPGLAASAYARVAHIANAHAPKLGSGSAAGDLAGSGPGFGDILREAIGAVAEAGRKSDAQTQAVAMGKANVVDVVTAVADTEVAVDAVVAVRDKVISAYEDIMKMPI